MATVINLPQDKSFRGNPGASVGPSIAEFLNQKMEEEKKKQQEEKKVQAFQAAFDSDATDAEVASNLVQADVGADVIASLMLKRQTAREDELTYQNVKAYNKQGQEVTNYVPKSDLGNIETILAKKGLSLVKPLETDVDDPTENETQASNIIASMGGDPQNPAARAAAMDLAKHRGEITEDINNHFGSKFGEDFKFDSREDKMRAQLADARVPRIMLLEGKERGQAIKEAIEFANQMIPQEEDVLDKDADSAEDKEEPSPTKKLIEQARKDKEQEDNKVSMGRFAGQDIKISKEANDSIKNKDYERAIQEVMKNYNLSRDAAIEVLFE